MGAPDAIRRRGALRSGLRVGQSQPVSDHARMQAIRPGNSHIARRLAVLRVRAWELADRAAVGEIDFIDAIDIAYSAALWSGLVADAGDDAVQEAIAPAFDSVGPA